MKPKVLFFVSEFWQAGGERQTYEIHSCIDKDRFEIDILCFLSLQEDKNKEDYYYQKHLDLGANIYFVSDLLVWTEANLLKKIRRRIHNEVYDPKKNVISFIDGYTNFLFFGEYTFRHFQQFISDEHLKKSLIFIHNSIFQVPNNYEGFDSSRKYNFVSGFLPDEVEIELSQFANCNHYYVPLSVDCEKKVPKRSFNNINSSRSRIGLFTRLTRHKPLDVFYYALHLLIQSNTDVELLIFGSGNPDDVDFNKCIEYLGLKNHITFKEHQEDMLNAAIENEIDLAWFHSYYGVPGGYASFDICTIEIPQIFWNFTPGGNNKLYEEFPSFDSLMEFVNYSKELLFDAKKRNELGQIQRQAIITHRNMREHIKQVENLILNFAEDV